MFRRLSIALFLTSLGCTAIAATVSAPPAARTVEAADEAFGLRLPDPYRWMEGESNAEFDGWLRAQGAYGRASSMPSRA